MALAGIDNRPGEARSCCTAAEGRLVVVAAAAGIHHCTLDAVGRRSLVGQGSRTWLWRTTQLSVDGVGSVVSCSTVMAVLYLAGGWWLSYLHRPTRQRAQKWSEGAAVRWLSGAAPRVVCLRRSEFEDGSVGRTE